MAETAGHDGATRTLSEDDFAVGIADRYFEDYAVGAVYEYGYASVTEAEIIAFAERFDPQPIHIDTKFAARGPFGGVIASGWHTAAIAMRWSLTTTYPRSPASRPREWTSCAGPHRYGPATRCGCAPRSWRRGAPGPSRTADCSEPAPSYSTSTTRPPSASRQ